MRRGERNEFLKSNFMRKNFRSFWEKRKNKYENESGWKIYCAVSHLNYLLYYVELTELFNGTRYSFRPRTRLLYWVKGKYILIGSKAFNLSKALTLICRITRLWNMKYREIHWVVGTHLHRNRVQRKIEDGAACCKIWKPVQVHLNLFELGPLVIRESYSCYFGWGRPGDWFPKGKGCRWLPKGCRRRGRQGVGARGREGLGDKW